MIYELRTYQLRPRATKEFESRLQQALPARERLSKLAGCWHTDIGPLNQVIELWPYEDRQHYDRVAEAVARAGGWPPVGGDLVEEVQVEILHPAPFMRPLTGVPQKLGPVYELRIYQIKPGQIPQVFEKWAPMLAGRETLSPLAGAWYTEQDVWFHLWPYPSNAERDRIRAEAERQRLWPPKGDYLVAQSSKILLPAAFSPLQ